VGHNVLKKQVLNRFTGGRKVLALHCGAEIVNDRKIELVAQGFPNLVANIAVASKYHRQAKTGAQASLRISCGNKLGHHYYAALLPSVYAPRDEHHIRSPAAHQVYALVVLTAIVQGNNVNDDGART
jgi:hypothetical protein